MGIFANVVKDFMHQSGDPVKGFGKLLVDKGQNFRLIEDGVGIFTTESEESFIADKALILFFFSDSEFKLRSDVSENAISSGVDSYLMCAFPFKDWEVELTGKEIKGLAFSISKLHELFGNLSLSNPEDLKAALVNYRSKSFYTRRDFAPAAQVLIHKIFARSETSVAGTLLLKAKLMEMLALYMMPERSSEQSNDCPYITDNLDWEKIREAEKILIHDIQNPPTIRELAKLVGTNELKLKTGFKHLYGNTIYGYLTNYRMDSARLFFEKERIQVKEVASKVGYANPSHFIAAFRKRFGVTPKKYVQSLNG